MTIESAVLKIKGKSNAMAVCTRGSNDQNGAHRVTGALCGGAETGTA